MTMTTLYATAVHEAAVSGDLEKMKAMVQQAEEWLKESGDDSAALESLKLEIAKFQR